MMAAGRVTIELNPDYVSPPWEASLVGAEGEGDYVVGAEATVRDFRAGSVFSSSSSSSWLDNLKIQLAVMYRSSPSLTVTMLACISVFLAWQVQPQAAFLRQNFLLNRGNLRSGHWPSFLLSAVSHIDPWHLILNLMTLQSVGPSVQRSLRHVGHSLGPFMAAAAAAGSLAFLLLSGAGGATGLGLSAVTLAMVAVYARTYPTAVLGTRIAGVVPIKMKAEKLLACLTAWSALGTFSRHMRSSSGIAHAAHLGGLLFGMAYHEMYMRREFLIRRWHHR
jgi:membrane associated rhomboid family serine protease